MLITVIFTLYPTSIPTKKISIAAWKNNSTNFSIGFVLLVVTVFVVNFNWQPKTTNHPTNQPYLNKTTTGTFGSLHLCCWCILQNLHFFLHGINMYIQNIFYINNSQKAVAGNSLIYSFSRLVEFSIVAFIICTFLVMVLPFSMQLQRSLSI